MGEKIRAIRAKEEAKEALNSLFKKAEGVEGTLLQEEKFWGALADIVEAMAELCTYYERQIPGTGGGGRKKDLYRMIPQAPELLAHTLRC